MQKSRDNLKTILPALGLFYFSSAIGAGKRKDKYKLLLESARMADKCGFKAIWTPERHFHPFGDLFPNPSVLSAAIAVETRNINIRAGSVVLPLHDPIRVAEEWSVVDNLSNGRVSIAFASGWQINDFVLQPGNYENRCEVLFDSVDQVKSLWRGDSILRHGLSLLDKPYPVTVKTYPRPTQAELPIWITSGGNTKIIEEAGRRGANVLTHFVNQSREQLENNIRHYRLAREKNGLNPKKGKITLMMHTLVGSNLEDLCPIIRPPLTEYLRTFNSLAANLRPENFKLRNKIINEKKNKKKEELLLAYGVDKYIQYYGLFGSVEDCRSKLKSLFDMGVDEIACLIDFGTDQKYVFQTIEALSKLNKK